MKSSTEAELVGASDFIPWTLWLKRILEGQGYVMDRTIFYQDNESAIKMEKNGIRSCGEKTRHIKIRYFFIKDILENDEIDLKYCRTEVMLADLLTKPLQGSLSKRTRDIIMSITTFPAEECIGDYRKVSKHIQVENTAGTRTDVENVSQSCSILLLTLVYKNAIVVLISTLTRFDM